MLTKKTFLSIMVLAFSVMLSAQTKTNITAEELLGRCSKSLETEGAKKIDFVINGNGETYPGTLTFNGRLFTMTAPGIRVWFDGTTQWTLVEDQNCVNITEPGDDELLETNPLVILLNYKKHYTARRIKGAPTGQKRVELTPKGQTYTGIKKAEIDFSDKTGLPSSLSLTFDNGSKVQAKIKEIQTIKKPAASAFKFNPKSYPGLEIVDLR